MTDYCIYYSEIEPSSDEEKFKPLEDNFRYALLAKDQSLANQFFNELTGATGLTPDISMKLDINTLINIATKMRKISEENRELREENNTLKNEIANNNTYKRKLFHLNRNNNDQNNNNNHLYRKF